jgi:L-asparagine transporter-like permease
MPLYPWMQIAGLSLLAAVLVTMGLDKKFYYLSWLMGVPWVVLISGAYFVWRGLNARGLQGAAQPVPGARAQNLPE